MKHSLIDSSRRARSALLFCLLALSLRADPIHGTRIRVDWPKLVSHGDISLKSPPSNSYGGLLLGNGDVAVSVYGPPHLLTLHVGKNDLWDYRDPMDEKRPVRHADFLAKYADPKKPPVANYLFDPAVDAHNVDIRNTYETTMPSSKPAGQIRFRTKARVSSGYQAQLHLWNAEAEVATGKDGPSLRTFVSYKSNIIAAEFNPGSVGEVDIELARHHDCTGAIPNGPTIGVDGREMWVRYTLPGDATNYPNGFEYAMVARVLNGGVTTEAIEKFATITQGTWRVGGASTQPVQAVESACVAHVKSAQPITMLVAIYTTRDDAKPFERARREVASAAKKGLANLERDHRQAWHKYWQRSFVELDGREFLNRMWYFDQYLLASAYRPGCIAPGLFGAWAWEDFPLFGNDYHWDYNMQQAIWGAFSSNHLEQVVPYEDAALSLLPAAMTDARETYGFDGAKFFLTSYPRTYAHNPFPLLHYDKMMSLNGWVAHPLWWKYLYSEDQEYLKTRAYPLMRASARFYEQYLTRNENGKYEIWPTAAWDVDFTPHLKFNRNFPMDLSFIKYLLRACVSASEVLNVDKDLRANWTKIAENLHDYPTADGPNGKVFSAYEGASAGYHFPLETMMIFPGDDIGLSTTSELRDIALRTLATMSYNSDEQLLKAMMRVRMGVDDIDTCEKQLQTTTRANGTISYPGQWFFWIHGCGNTIWINDSLVQSYDGTIRFAPVKRKDAARFGNLRTVGAFLVSGEIRPGGELAYATIESEAGSACRLIRPWPGELRIRKLDSMEPVVYESAGDALTFKTTKGGRYVLDRPSQPWETVPAVDVP